MIRYTVAIATILLFQLSVTAQPTDSSDTFSPFLGAFRNLGGYLNISYDGERLKMFLVASLPDNNNLAKKLMKEKDGGETFSSTPGELKMGDQSSHIMFSS